MRKILIALTVFVFGNTATAKETTLLNISYDPTREFYQEFNRAFSTFWQSQSGQSVRINQSHGGSGKQAISVINGIESDVVTLALAQDIDAIVKSGKLLAIKKLGDQQVEIVVPSVSILAEPTIAVVDHVVDKKGTWTLAQAYLEYLYSPIGQDIAAKHFYRPRDNNVAQRYSAQFPELRLFTIDKFSGWEVTNQKHFVQGAIFDQIYAR